MSTRVSAESGEPRHKLSHINDTVGEFVGTTAGRPGSHKGCPTACQFANSIHQLWHYRTVGDSESRQRRGRAAPLSPFPVPPCHGEPVPDHHETDQAAYFSLSEMGRFDEPFDEFCEWIARRVLRGQYHLIPSEPSDPYRPHLAYL